MRRSFQRITVLIATAVLCLIAVNAGAETAGAPSAAEWQVFLLTNQERAAMGIRPLQWDNRLGKAAQGHAANMAATGRFAHNLDGKNPGQRMKAAGFPWMRWSENIYYGGGHYGTPENAVDGWMDSRGHRINILDRAVTHLGVGVRRDSKGRVFFVQNFARP